MLRRHHSPDTKKMRKFKPKAPPTRIKEEEEKESDNFKVRTLKYNEHQGQRLRSISQRGRERGRGRFQINMGRTFFDAKGGGDAGPASEADIDRAIAKDERRKISEQLKNNEVGITETSATAEKAYECQDYKNDDEDDDKGMEDLDGGDDIEPTMKVLGDSFQEWDDMKPIVIPFRDSTSVHSTEVFASPHDAEALQEEMSSAIFFVQLPTVLPQLLPESRINPSEQNADNANLKAENEHRSRQKVEKFDQSLYNMQAGQIGKLQIHASGKIRLLVGGVYFDVSPGMPCHFTEELVCIDTKEKALSSFGQVTRKLVCAPNFEELCNSDMSATHILRP